MQPGLRYLLFSNSVHSGVCVRARGDLRRGRRLANEPKFVSCFRRWGSAGASVDLLGKLIKTAVS